MLILAFVGTYILLRLAFGPIQRTIEINLSNNQKLNCKETYNGDFAGEFYDVDFSLIDNDEVFEMGRATFSKGDWDKQIKLYSMGDWYILPVKDLSYLKLLAINARSKLKTDTVLSPHDLRLDTNWKAQNKDVPAWNFTGDSELTSLEEGELPVEFGYRIGNGEQFRHVRQQIRYNFDTISGNLIVKEIYSPEDDN